MAKPKPYEDVREGNPSKGDLICLFTRENPSISENSRMYELNSWPVFLARFDQVNPTDSWENLSLLTYEFISGVRESYGFFLGEKMPIIQYSSLVDSEDLLLRHDSGGDAIFGILRWCSSPNLLEYYYPSVKPRYSWKKDPPTGYEGWYVGKEHITKRFSRDEWFKWWVPIINKLPDLGEKLDVNEKAK